MIAETSEDTVRYLSEISEAERSAIAERARARIMRQHAGRHRAEELVRYLYEATGGVSRPAAASGRASWPRSRP